MMVNITPVNYSWIILEEKEVVSATRSKAVWLDIYTQKYHFSEQISSDIVQFALKPDFNTEVT